MDFSIIIPAKNEAGNIKRCIHSINQNCDYPQDSYEIIVVDNGSTDNTAHIAESIGARVFEKPGLTIAALRNYGAQVARGKVFVFLDADCSVKPRWLKKASVYLNQVDIVCFGSPPDIPENSSWVQKTWFLVRSRGNVPSEAPWLESMNMFVKRNAFKKIEGFDETLITCEDVDLSYRVSKMGKIISDPAIEAVHHGEAATVREFFKKERWRGKSNYIGLIRHGLKMDEIPSLILPLYYGIGFLFICYCLIFHNLSLTIMLLILWQIPLLALTALKVKKYYAGVSQFMKLSALYNIYYMARFLSLMG